MFVTEESSTARRVRVESRGRGRCPDRMDQIHWMRYGRLGYIRLAAHIEEHPGVERARLFVPGRYIAVLVAADVPSAPEVKGATPCP